ncbi:MAG: class I SAM-dependent methyltransferase [Actinomycetota bacterium]
MSGAVPASPFRSHVPLANVPIRDEVAEVQRRFIERYGEDPDDKGGWYHDGDWYRISFVLGSLRPGGRFLDIGLGAGQFINAVAATGWFDEVRGADPTTFRKYVEFYDGIERTSDGVASLPYPDDHFDVVTCMEVLEHVPTEVFWAGIDELRRVCRGQLIMSVPYEEPEPISRSHVRRFEAADVLEAFPGPDRILLDRPRMPWAMMEEWHGPAPAPASSLRLTAAEHGGTAVRTRAPSTNRSRPAAPASPPAGALVRLRRRIPHGVRARLLGIARRGRRLVSR